MSVRPLTAACRRVSAAGTTALVVACIAAGGQTIACAQHSQSANQRPPQGTPGNLHPYDPPRMPARYWPYPVKDPTADERAVVAGRVYRAVLDEWAQRAIAAPGPERAAAELEARSSLELIERLGPWSLRWQDAQDNAAKSLSARYQAMSDHLGRMSALEDGGFLRETGHGPGGPVGPKLPRGAAEVARFFRPIDELEIDRIAPAFLPPERPLSPRGIDVTPDQQAAIADRAYHLILDDAVDRFLAPQRDGEVRPGDVAIFDALLAERLGFWSDLWRQSQDVAARDPSWRSPEVGDRSARVASARALGAGPGGRVATMRSHIERMSELENGHFFDDALKRAGRSAAGPIDMTKFPEFAEVIRFFRIEAESRLPGASRPKGTDIRDYGQAATARRIYRAISDDAARRYREAPRAGEALADIRLIFDTRLAERLAAWSIRWAQAQIRADLTGVAKFDAVRSHIKRMASLENGGSFHDAFERAGPRAVGGPAPALPPEFADVARFFRLEALWELAQMKSR